MTIKKKKLNKKNLLFIITLIAYLVSLTFFTSSILSLTGIETLYRMGLLILLYLFFFLYFFAGFFNIINKKYKLLTITSIIMLIMVPIFSIGSYYINKTFAVIEDINKDMVTYSTSLVVLNGNTINNSKTTTIGIINDKNNIEGYILAEKLLEKENLKNVSLKEYDDYPEMLNDLLSSNIKGVLISSNYLIMFGEEIENLKNTTTPLYTFTEERKKEEEIVSNKTLDKPFSLLLIGVDSVNPKMNANQAFNGDTLMVITFNPNTLNATMFSIPRDTYATIACKNKKAKINTSAYHGTTCVINTVEELIDIDIDYYVKINFKGVVALVNAMGGVDVDVPYSFCEQNSSREFGNSTIYVEKGLQHLDGEQALALARNRKGWPNYCASKWNMGVRNDFVRGQNQQLVVTGIAKEVRNIKSIKEFYNILNAISSNIDTNMTTDQMLSFYEVGKNILTNSIQSEEFITIEKTYLTGYDLYINSRYTFQYYNSSLKSIISAMKVNLELTEPDATTTFDFSIKDVYEKSVIGKSYSGSQNKIETIPNFINRTKTYAETWASGKNIVVTYQDVTEFDDKFDATKEDGVIVSQSVRATTLLDTVNSITLYVIKK